MLRIFGAVVVAMCGVQAVGQTAPAGFSNTAALQPSVQLIRQVLGTLQPDRWKMPGEWKQATATDIGSIRRDLDGTLPGLLVAADAAPGSIEKQLAAENNVRALYNVVLRVTERAHMAAPEPQSGGLDECQAMLEGAQEKMDSHLLVVAQSSDKQVADLTASLKTQTAAATAAQAQVQELQAKVTTVEAEEKGSAKAAPSKASVAAAKKRAAAKSAAKPVTTTPAKPVVPATSAPPKNPPGI